MTEAEDLTEDPVIAALLANVPGTQLRIEADFTGGQAWARLGCDGQPYVIVAADLTDGDRLPLYGAVAHEMAHHLLGHTRPSPATLALRVAERVVRPLLTLLAAFSAGAGLWNASAALLGMCGVVLVLTAQLLQMDERAADAESVRLLDAAGVAGVDVAVASLAGAEEAWWERVTAWAWSSHPSVASRRRAIHALTSR